MPVKVHKSSSINPFETLSNNGLGMDFFGDILKNAVGTYESSAEQIPTHGDLTEGKEIHFGKSKARLKTAGVSEHRTTEALHRQDIAGGMQYHEQFRSLRSEASLRETSEIKRAVEEIKIELQRLVSSSQVLQAEFGQVSISQAPATPGKYHVNFFQWVLTVIRQARMKVEDAGAWQSAIKGKGKKRGGFWDRAKAKNEGTSFLLHHDRNVSTQTG